MNQTKKELLKQLTLVFDEEATLYGFYEEITKL